jgi:hypothetical protein
VVVEGEFYGPPLADPKLPEAVKKDYHPGWGHLAAFKTKLVVHVIHDVKPAPAPTTRRLSWPVCRVVAMPKPTWKRARPQAAWHAGTT